MATQPHSAAFISEMKERLLEEQNTLQKELTSIERPEYGRADEENATEFAEFAASSSTKETLTARLSSVERALADIDAGSYGVTTEGEVIPEDRLRANPAAKTIIK